LSWCGETKHKMVVDPVEYVKERRISAAGRSSFRTNEAIVI